jgi:hypothetical protein
LPIPGFDVVNTAIAVPLWILGAIAALFVVLGVVAIVRFGTNAAAGFMRISLVLIVAGLAWVYLERAGVQDRMAERGAFEARLAALNAQANAPGSTLACLNGLGGETVELACEKSIFATPETVAAAVTYTSARLALLADAVDFARANPAHASGYTALKRSLEADLFGLVSYVLATRDNCTAQQCDAFQFMSDLSKVQANLKDQTYQTYIGRYAGMWPVRTVGGSRSAAESTPVAAAPPPMPMSSKYSFPSAASIPPVSIMNAEPAAPAPAAPPPVQAAAPPPPAAAPPAAAPPTPQRRPAQAAPAPARPAAPPRTANQQAPGRTQPLQLQAQPAAPGPAAPAAESEPMPLPPPGVQ